MSNMLDVGSLVTVVTSRQRGIIALARVTDVVGHSGQICVVLEFRTLAYLMAGPTPTTVPCYSLDEGTSWIRGDHAIDSLEVQAMLAAAALTGW